MTQDNIFSFVKSHVVMSDFVRTLPTLTSISSTGRGKWRCNNVISGGSNATSMVIDDDAGFFKVFSHDQQYGDVITLYQLTLGDESGSVLDQAVALAHHMGVVIDDSLLYKNDSGVSTTQIISTLETLSTRAHTYLMESHNKDAQKVRDYLFKERGMEEQLAQEWRLGVFPEKDSHMKTMLAGLSTDVLVKAGIASEKRSSFIPMQGRLVYPIFSPSNKTISFSSRIVKGVKTPLPDSKYINTSSTKAYDKSMTLYGQHLIGKNTTEVIICEGNMDVIALNAATDSHTAAVATCGTALTRGHVSMLSKKKNISTVDIMFDADDAGQDAAASSLWLHNHWDEVYSLPVIGGKDPWDIYVDKKSFEDSFNVRSSLMTAAVRHKHKTLKKNDFIEWCADSIGALNFIDDRELLIHDIISESGVSRKSLIVASQQSKSHSGVNHHDNEKILSEGLSGVIPALLSLDSVTRKCIAYPVLISSSQQLSFTLCGCETQDDEDVLYSIVSGKRSKSQRQVLAEAFSLHPEEEEYDSACINAAQYISRQLLFCWRYDETLTPVVEFIPAITTISQGLSQADGRDQLSFVFEVIAATSMKKKEKS